MPHVKIYSDGTTDGTTVYLIEADGQPHIIPADSIVFECERGGRCFATVTLPVDIAAIRAPAEVTYG